MPPLTYYLWQRRDENMVAGLISMNSGLMPQTGHRCPPDRTPVFTCSLDWTPVFTCPLDWTPVFTCSLDWTPVFTCSLDWTPVFTCSLDGKARLRER